MVLGGAAVAAVTLFVSWRFGFVFFLLPLFFVWSWGGGGGGERSGGRAEGGGGDRARAWRDQDERGGERGLDGEGI